MKKLLSIVLIFTLVFASAMPAFAADNSGTDLELVKVKGSVTITTAAGKKVDFNAEKATKLISGYTLKTGAASYAYISLDQAQAVRLDASTTVTIDKKGKKLEVNLVSGALSYDVKEPLKKDQSTNVSTSNSITGIRGTYGVVRTFFDRILGRQVSTTTLFDGHSLVGTLGEGGNIVSYVMVYAGNLLESAGNTAKVLPLTKEAFTGFVAMDLAEDPSLLARVEKGLAESDNPEAANIDVRGIAADAENILAAEEQQAKEDAKALQTALESQKAEQERLEAAAKEEQLKDRTNSDDAVQLFEEKTADETATDEKPVSATGEDETTGSGGGGGGGGGSHNTNTSPAAVQISPTSADEFRAALAQASNNSAAGQPTTITIPENSNITVENVSLPAGTTLHVNNNLTADYIDLEGGTLRGTLNSSGATIRSSSGDSTINGTITAYGMEVSGTGKVNIASGSTVVVNNVDITGGEVNSAGTLNASTNFNISGGTFNNTAAAGPSGSGTFTMTGGTINNTTEYGVFSAKDGSISGGGTINGGIVIGGTMVIESSTLASSKGAALKVDGTGDVTVKSGTITGTGHEAINSNGSLTIEGGTISGGGEAAVVLTRGATISGGNITGIDTIGIKLDANYNDSIVMSGGTVLGSTGVSVNADSGKWAAFYMTGGSVSGTGDGVQLNGEGSSVLRLGEYASPTGGAAIGTISGSGTIAGAEGHGVNVGNGNTFTFNSGKVTTGATSGNVYAVYNNGGTLTFGGDTGEREAASHNRCALMAGRDQDHCTNFTLGSDERLTQDPYVENPSGAAPISHPVESGYWAFMLIE